MDLLTVEKTGDQIKVASCPIFTVLGIYFVLYFDRDNKDQKLSDNTKNVFPIKPFCDKRKRTQTLLNFI